MLQKSWTSSPGDFCSKAERCLFRGSDTWQGLSIESDPWAHETHQPSRCHCPICCMPSNPKPNTYQILSPRSSSTPALTKLEITCPLRKYETNLTGLTTPALSSNTARSSFQLSLTGSKMTNICNICQVMNALKRVMQLSTFWWL